MRIAVEGCAHGELDLLYDSIESLQQKEGIKLDLLICCGDFQSVRNKTDLCAMSVSERNQKMCTFYKYYSGERKAPILTIFIGGNHEASNYLQELPYGGWVAPNIYYLGRAGVVNVGGLRIGGLSGIFKTRDYLLGLWECPPYTPNSLRSVYHVRALDSFRLSLLQDKVHIMLSHDWPKHITDHGDKSLLLKFKPFFRENIDVNQPGSVPADSLLHKLKPDYWFSAHMHCRFEALVKHDNGSETKFLALDKCVPKRKHLQIVDIPSELEGDRILKYDAEWLAILKSTNYLMSVKNEGKDMPGPGENERHFFTPSEEDKEEVIAMMQDMTIYEESFVKTAPIFDPEGPKAPPTKPVQNPQTVNLCNVLGIDDPVELVLANSGRTFRTFKSYTTVASLFDEPASPSSSGIQHSNVSLAAPITPRENTQQLSQELPSSSGISLMDSFNTTDECSTSVSATKKTLKRTNAFIYLASPEQSGGTASTALDTECTPCKVPSK